MTDLKPCPEQKFWNRTIIVKNGCWIWIGSKNNRGYGKAVYQSKLMLAHRIAWIYKFGEIPDGLCICHKCDNPACVNPAHLFLGTAKDNMQDCINKGRHNHCNGNTNKTFCKHGHEFTLSNTRYSKIGERQCRTCDREWHRRHCVSK